MCRKISTFATLNDTNMEYYININNEKRGPYTIDELHQRNISAETLIMAEGTNQWQAAWQVEELRDLLRVSPREEEIIEGRPFSEERLQGVEPLQEEEAYTTKTQSLHQKQHKGHGKTLGCLFALLFVAIIGATMFFTCPQHDDHKEKLSHLVVNAVNQVIERQLGSDNMLLAKGMQMISNSLLGDIVDTAIDSMLTVDNYGVCSIGKINYDGKDNIVSIGLFGHVFTVNQDKVTDVVEHYVRQLQSQAQNQIGNQLQQQVVDPIKDQIKQQVIDPIKESIKGAVGDILNELSGAIDGADDDHSDITDTDGNTEE